MHLQALCAIGNLFILVEEGLCACIFLWLCAVWMTNTCTFLYSPSPPAHVHFIRMSSEKAGGKYHQIFVHTFPPEMWQNHLFALIG